MPDQSQDQVLAAWREMLTSLLDRYLSALGAGIGKDGSQTTQAAVHEKIMQDQRTEKDHAAAAVPLVGDVAVPQKVAQYEQVGSNIISGMSDHDVYRLEQQRPYQSLQEYAEAAGAAGVSLSEDQLAQMHKFYKAQSEIMSENVERAKMQAGMGPDTYYMTSSYLSRKALEWGRSISDAIDGIFLENQKVQDREINRGK